MPKKPKLSNTNFALVLVAVALLFGFVSYMLILRLGAPAKVTQVPPTEAPTKVDTKPPVEKPPAGHVVKVAIIIDDMGVNTAALDEITGLHSKITVAVMPGLSHSEDIARRAKSAGLDVLLHLPMQPKEKDVKGLGQGALMEGMDASEITETVSKDLETVPGAVGVNNHMGSAVTEDEHEMDAVMGELKGRGLFFVDSRTTAGSRAVSAAKDAGVPVASRDVFLDNSDNPDELKRQFERMVDLALKNGSAIAIGHPHPNTLKMLKEEIPSLKEKGIEVVGVSELIK